MACRKNFIDLTNDERDLLAGAFNDLFARGLIGTFADEHEHHFSSGIHRGPVFLPWHRYFLLELEAEMRSGRSNSALGLDQRSHRQRETDRYMNGSHAGETNGIRNVFPCLNTETQSRQECYLGDDNWLSMKRSPLSMFGNA